MYKRPNPLWHMMTWGLSSGFILALSYIIILIDFFDGELGDLFSFLPLILWLAVVFGGVPGVVMGFFLGLALWGMLRNSPMPFTKTDMNRKRPAVYGIIFSITLFPSLIITSLIIDLDFLGSDFDVFLWIPPFIAGIAATYVAHRYMYTLCLSSGGIDSRKSKAKNEAEALSRLTDNVPESLQSDDMIERTQSLSEK